MTCADPNARAQAWLDRLERALAAGEAGQAAALFADPGYWRDILAFTWNLKTMEGRSAIAAMLDANLTRVGARGFKLSGDARDLDGQIEALFAFATRQGRGQGVLRLKDDGAAVLLTTLDALEGHEERAGPGRASGVRHGAFKSRTTWLEDRGKRIHRAWNFTAALCADRGRRPGGHCAWRQAAATRGAGSCH